MRFINREQVRQTMQINLLSICLLSQLHHLYVIFYAPALPMFFCLPGLLAKSGFFDCSAPHHLNILDNRNLDNEMLKA